MTTPTSSNMEMSNRKPADHPDPMFRDARPIEPVPVSYGVAWMYFGILLCLMVAWWFPATILFQRWMYPPAKPRGPQDTYTFVALAYEGVSKKTNEISADRFREQLQALNDHGYVPLTLKDIRALYAEGKPLPRKGVLLTFDHARKTSYFSAEPIIRKAGWRAVMFLWTRPMMDEDPASLLWPYVRAMLRSGIWEIGAQSHDGFARVPSSGSGPQGHFMTTPRWLENQRRVETETEFQSRVEADHARCLDIIRRKLGIKPIAYAYPYGDFGQYHPEAQTTRWLNMGLVARYYALGFIAGNFAVNDRSSDPRRLNRLRVRTEWTGDDLVAILDRSWPQPEPTIQADAAQSRLAWIVDWGRMQVAGNRVILGPAAQATGAKMWLAGSDLSMDFHASIRFVLRQGQMGVYLRATPDEESYVYLGIGSGGHNARATQDFQSGLTDVGVWLRQKQVGGPRFTLASSSMEFDRLREHVLELMVRDRLLFATLDGRPLFPAHVALRGEPKPGLFGLSVWDARPEQARLDVESVLLDNPSASIAAWTYNAERDPYVVTWLHQHALRLTELSPTWIRVAPKARISTATWDATLYKKMTRMYDLKLIPQVVIQDIPGMEAIDASRVAVSAADAGFDGVMVNLAALSVPSVSRVTNWLQHWSGAFFSRGLALYVKLPYGYERPLVLSSILAVLPNVQIAMAPGVAMAGNLAVTNQALKRLEEIPDPGEKTRIPLSYDISALSSSNEVRTIEAHISELQTQGQAAFNKGEYEKALAAWSEWRDADPVNPRALMLMGDAWNRMGESAKAMEHYDRSLDLDPGQILLALRRVQLLDAMGQGAEARQSLNFYSRLFPDNPDILLAQSKWLKKHGRDQEARNLAHQVLTRIPDNIEALALMVSLTPNGQPDSNLIRQLAEIGARPENQARLALAIQQHDLLAIPAAYSLVELVEGLATTTADPRIRDLYDRLRSRNNAILETFASGRVSAAWQTINGHWTSDVAGLGCLTANAENTEASLRWLGSDRLADAFIEAHVQVARGSCWLYARRTADHYVRFGYDSSGRLHLQIRKDGRVLIHESQPWDWPGRPVTLRLELRGDGAAGLVDGRAVFQTPAPIPADFGYGWVGLSGYDPQRGKAALTLSRLAAGILPVRLAVLPEITNATDVNALLDDLLSINGGVTGLSPRWFVLRPGGLCETRPMFQDRLLRMFVRYYRLRLMPILDVPADTNPADINFAQLARQHRVDGFVLRFHRAPPVKSLDQLRNAVSGSRLYILAVVTPGSAHQAAACYPLASARDLFPRLQESQPMAIIPMNDEVREQAVDELPETLPALFVYQ